MVVPIRARRVTKKELDRGLKLERDSIVEVEWLDACSHMEVDKINLNNLRELLCVTTTVGKLAAQDDEVLVVASNISKVNGADLFAIPIRWIESITIVDTAGLLHKKRGGETG